jgi:integrase
VIRRQHSKSGTRYLVRVGTGPARSFHRLKDAEEYEEQERRNRRRAKAGLPIEQGPITFDALCELWLAGYDAPSKKWTEQMLVHSRTKFGKQLVRTIRSEQIGAWLNKLDLSVKTRSHVLERMRVVLNAGVEWGYLSRSPARRGAVRSPGANRIEEVQPFEDWQQVEQVAEALDSLKPGWGRVIRFACATGLRPGEWQAIKWMHIDLKNRVLSVPGTKNRNAQRSIPLSVNALGALGPQGLPHIPAFQLPCRYDRFRGHWWPKALKLAGLAERTPNQTRHTFATLALQVGVPVDVVSKWLGHSSVDITLRYYARYTRPVIDRNLALLDTLGEEPTREEEAK